MGCTHRFDITPPVTFLSGQAFQGWKVEWRDFPTVVPWLRLGTMKIEAVPQNREVGYSPEKHIPTLSFFSASFE